MAGQSNPFTPITFSALLPLKVSISTVNMPPPTDTAVLVRGGHIYGNFFTKMGGWGIFTEIMFTVNMPPIKNSPHKTGKSMLFFTFEIPLFSVMSINSQIYMTKPKQARKTLSENTEKTFSVIMPPLSSKGGGHNCGNYCT